MGFTLTFSYMYVIHCSCYPLVPLPQVPFILLASLHPIFKASHRVYVCVCACAHARAHMYIDTYTYKRKEAMLIFVFLCLAYLTLYDLQFHVFA